MKVLTATSETQGARDNDFDWTIEGELVWIESPCARDERDPDGGRCGCGRAFSGLSSHRATTTARVSDLDLTRDDMITAYAGYLDSAGYGVFTEAELADEVDQLLDMCATWRTGDVIERRLDVLSVRTPRIA
jgi:hypothetical protein